MTIETIKRYMNPKTKFSSQIKQEITLAAQELHIPVPTCSCRNKWFDVLMMIYKKMKAGERITEEENPNWVYLRPNGVVIDGTTYDGRTGDKKIRELRMRYPKLFTTLYKRREV